MVKEVTDTEDAEKKENVANEESTIQAQYDLDQAGPSELSASDPVGNALTEQIRFDYNNNKSSAPYKLNEIQTLLEKILQDTEIFSRLLADVQRYKNEKNLILNINQLIDINNFELQLVNNYPSSLARAIAVIISVPANTLPLEAYVLFLTLLHHGGIAIFNSHDPESTGREMTYVEIATILLYGAFFMVYACAACSVASRGEMVEGLYPREYDGPNLIFILVRACLLMMFPILNEARTERLAQRIKNQLYSWSIQRPQLTEENTQQFNVLLTRYNALAEQPLKLDETRDLNGALEKIRTMKAFFQNITSDNNHPLKGLLTRLSNITIRFQQLQTQLESSRDDLANEVHNLKKKLKGLKGFNAIILSDYPINIFEPEEMKGKGDDDVLKEIQLTRDEYVYIQEKIKGYNETYTRLTQELDALKQEVETLARDLETYKEERPGNFREIVIPKNDDVQTPLLSRADSQNRFSVSGYEAFGLLSGSASQGSSSSGSTSALPSPSNKPRRKGKEKVEEETVRSRTPSPIP